MDGAAPVLRVDDETWARWQAAAPDGNVSGWLKSLAATAPGEERAGLALPRATPTGRPRPRTAPRPRVPPQRGGTPVRHQPEEMTTCRSTAWPRTSSATTWRNVRAGTWRGLVAKKLDSRYRPGERGWIKLKNSNYWRRDAEREAMQWSRERASFGRATRTFPWPEMKRSGASRKPTSMLSWIFLFAHGSVYASLRDVLGERTLPATEA